MSRQRASVLQFVALALVWGVSFLLIKVALAGMSPTQVASGRLLIGAATLGILMVLGRRPLPRALSTWGHLAVLGLLYCAVPFGLYAWAEQTVASSLASIINATTPLMTAVAMLIGLRSEKLSVSRGLALLTGFGGVLVVLLGPETFAGAGASGLTGLAGPLACLGSTACYGTGFVYLRRFVVPLGLPALTSASMQVGLGTLASVLFGCVSLGRPIAWTPAIVGAMLALGALGTGLAYVWNTNLVSAWGAASASTVTYVIPLVGVVAGALVLGEKLSVRELIGGLIVLSSVIALNRLAGRVVSKAGPQGPNR